MSVRKGVIVTIAAVVLISAAGVIGWTIGRPPATDRDKGSGSVATSQPDASVQVAAAVAKQYSMSRSTRVSGHVVPLHNVTAVTRVGGEVQWIVGDIGTPVEKGEPLAIIDDHDWQLQVRQAEATLRQAEASFQRAIRGAATEEIKQVEASVAQAEAGFRLADESLQRIQSLYAAGAVARDTLDTAQSQHDMAGSQLEAARQMLAQVRRGASAEELDMAEAQVAQAQVAVDHARKQLDDTVIRAPITGQVAMRHTDVGAMVGSGSPIMTLVYIDEVTVEIGVSDRLVSLVKPGMTVPVTVQALSPQSFVGEITAVSPVADAQGRLFPVRIRLDNADQSIKPGMTATADIETERRTDAVAVPEDAIVYDDVGPFVYVIDESSRVAERRVNLGLSQDGWIQVDAVAAGEWVVTSRQRYLAPGYSVRHNGEAL